MISSKIRLLQAIYVLMITPCTLGNTVDFVTPSTLGNTIVFVTPYTLGNTLNPW